jgi:hypothetical protein
MMRSDDDGVGWVRMTGWTFLPLPFALPNRTRLSSMGGEGPTYFRHAPPRSRGGGA